MYIGVLDTLSFKLVNCFLRLLSSYFLSFRPIIPGLSIDPSYRLTRTQRMIDEHELNPVYVLHEWSDRVFKCWCTIIRINEWWVGTGRAATRSGLQM
jgi:hypothetical protein